MRSTLKVFSVYAVCILISVSTFGPARGADTTPLRILFPAYGNPYNADGKAMWDKLAYLSHDLPAGLYLDVIFNPASGPGKTRDPNYLDEKGVGPLANVQGLRILGYVTTSYGTRPADEIKQEIDKYATGFYSGYVSGIFFDEMSSDLDTAGYYRELASYVRTTVKPYGMHEVIAIGNPGIGEVQTPVTETRLRDYALAMDQLVVFENAATQYKNASPSAVSPFLKPKNLVHIIHSQAKWSPQILATIQSRGAGNLFVTDDVMANPYDKLPSYFDDLCRSVAERNTSR